MELQIIQNRIFKIRANVERAASNVRFSFGRALRSGNKGIEPSGIKK